MEELGELCRYKPNTQRPIINSLVRLHTICVIYNTSNTVNQRLLPFMVVQNHSHEVLTVLEMIRVRKPHLFLRNQKP